MKQDLIAPNKLMVAPMLHVISVHNSVLQAFDTSHCLLMALLDSPRGEHAITVSAPSLTWHFYGFYAALVHIKYFSYEPT